MRYLESFLSIVYQALRAVCRLGVHYLAIEGALLLAGDYYAGSAASLQSLHDAVAARRDANA
jgi:hypothetical protein